MSFLGGLGNIGGIGKLLDPGALVKDVVNGFLPKDMKVVGDVAGAVVDFKTGNFIGAAQLGMEAVKDLPQAAKAMQGDAANGSNPQGQLSKAAQSALEPPPPPASQGEKPLDLGGLFAAIGKLTKLLTDLLNKNGAGASATAAKPDDTAKPDGKTSTNGSTSPTKSDGATENSSAVSTNSFSARSHGEHVHVDVHTHAAGGWRDRAHAETHADARPSGWRGEPRTHAPSERTDAQSAGKGEARTHVTASGTNGSSAGPATSTSSAATPSTPAASTASTETTPAVKSSHGETITSLDQIKGMSDSAIRDAVINGRISPEVAKDQTAMMVLQQRMQAITEMNNLMTGMLRALHDMQMAVIQNIRI